MAYIYRTSYRHVLGVPRRYKVAYCTKPGTIGKAQLKETKGELEPRATNLNLNRVTRIQPVARIWDV